MQPTARLSAAIELLDLIEQAMAARRAPADSIVQDYFRARRYAGSKDKRAISDIVYAILRGRALLVWASAQAGLKVDARGLVLAHLALNDADALKLFGGEDRFAPAAFDAAEEAALAALAALKCDAAPLADRLNIPDWALGGLTRRFGEQLPEAMAALSHTAALAIRLNPLKVDIKNLSDKIRNDLQDFEKTNLSPIGFRATSSVNLAVLPAYRDGLVEVQDEAAQVASLLVEASAGQQVVDLCAGAGGKSLLVGALMANKGQVHAFDISGRRLSDLRKRMQRAGARNIQPVQLPEEGEARDSHLSALLGKVDRVIVDIPCSGTGTWRRSPDQRWRFDDESLTRLTDTQYGLLTEGASLVRPGGRLAYMTCSLLPEENEDIVARFLAENEGWQVQGYADVWQRCVGTDVPKSLSLMDGTLQLAPHVHGTDGFFVALLERLA